MRSGAAHCRPFDSNLGKSSPIFPRMNRASQIREKCSAKPVTAKCQPSHQICDDSCDGLLGRMPRPSLVDILMGAKMPSNPGRIAIILLALSLLCACGRPPAENASTSADSQKLPFDHPPRTTGISPSQSLIPSTTKLPEGTPIPIRLQTPLSSASSHAGDTFSATVDEPVVLEGQTLVARGTPTTGRVLEAKPSGRSAQSSLEPGYLRIVLVSLNVGGRPLMIETSSIFAKGGSREERNSATGAAFGAGQKDSTKDKNEEDKDIVFAIDRRLNFRLARTVDLQ